MLRYIVSKNVRKKRNDIVLSSYLQPKKLQSFRCDHYNVRIIFNIK